MVNFTEIKEQITASFENGKGFPTDLALDGPTVGEFLAGLDLDGSALEFAQPDDRSLTITYAKSQTLDVPGVLPGKLTLETLTVTLTQQEGESLGVGLDVAGYFKRKSSQKRLDLTGALARGEAVSLAIALTTEDVPQLPELAQWVGLQTLTANLNGLGFELPTLATVEFGVDLSSREMRLIAATGTLTLASCPLEAAVTIDPDATLKLKIAEGEDLTLTEAIAALGLSAQDLPDIALDSFGVTVQPSAKTYDMAATLASDWAVDVGGSTLAVTQVRVALAAAEGSKTLALTGAVQLGASTLAVSATWSGEEPLTLLCDLEDGDTVELSSAVERLMGSVASLPVELPDFVLTELKFSIVPSSGAFSFLADSDDLWGIDIGETGLELDDVTLQITRTVSESGTKATTGAIAGTLAIAGVECRCEYDFPGEFVIGGTLPAFNLSAILQDLAGGSALRDLPVPLSVLSMTCDSAAIQLAPKSKTLAVSASSKLGTTEINLSRGTSGWNFVVGFAPPTSWKFSSIADELSVLDGLKFSDTALILASSADRSLALSTVTTPDDSAAVIRGLNFFATMDLTGTGVDSLLGLDGLTVYTAIGGKPSDLVIEAAIAGEFDLGNNVLFGDIKFQLRPAPSNFSLALLGTVTAVLDNSTLRFVGGMAVTPRSAIFQATMEGLWNEPFDTRNVAIANVALELGVSFPPPLPSVGLAGSLQVGDFAGAVAVKFDAAVPTRSMIAIAFNQLYLMDVIRAFCGTAIAQAIPAGLTKTVLDIGFEDVNIYIVPQPTTIGTLTFEQGFYLGGTLVFAGWRASASLNIDYTDGTELKAELDAIDIGGIFKLTGAKGETNPSLYLKVSPTTVPALKVSGAVELLGIRSETYIEFSDSGFYFLSAGSLFGLFNTSLEVSGTDFQNGGSYWVKATMENDLLEYLRDNATKAIKKAADAATKELSDAQDKVNGAQKDVNKLSNDIKRMRETIQRERDRDAKRLQDARSAVTSAQNTVNSLQKDIDAMRKKVQRERDATSKDFNNAKNAVTKAQRDVNSIQGDINSTKSRISKLKKDIDKKKKWYKKSKWHQKSYRWAEYSAYAAAKGTEIGALYTKIGGLETAKASANGVLEAAKATLRGIEAGMNTFPIDSDPRIVGLFTAKESANATLVASKATLKGIEASIQTIPMELDPRLSSLYTAKETANAALEVAELTLEGVKRSVGAVAEVSSFIVSAGLGGLLDVKSASFEGSLQATQGGSVSMKLAVVFMQGKPQNLSLAFNFKSPIAAAEELAKKLLPS